VQSIIKSQLANSIKFIKSIVLFGYSLAYLMIRFADSVCSIASGFFINRFVLYCNLMGSLLIEAFWYTGQAKL